MTQCANCYSEIKNANTCQKCGHRNSYLVSCEACAGQMSKNAAQCPTCAHPNRLLAYEGAVKSKILVGLLAIFLGTFGAHRFYMNEARMGLLYLIFCWTFIPTVVGIIEGLIYLLQSDERFKERQIKARTKK